MGYGLNNNIIKSTSDGTSVISTVETISGSYLIPANTVKVGDILTLYSRIKRTVTTVTTWSAKIYLNTSSTLVGATQVGVISSASSVNANDFGRILIVKSATQTEIIDVSAYTAVVRYNNALVNTNLNIDWTVDQYLLISILLTATPETALVSGTLLIKN